MKFGKMAVALVVTALGFAQASAQTADEIVSKYLDAEGGKDNLAALKSATVESNVQVMGNEAPSKVTVLFDKGFRLESQVQGQQMITVYTDKGGWMINPMMGSTTPQALPDDMYKQGKDQIVQGGPLYNYAARGGKVELVSKSDSAYLLKLTTADKIETTFYIDPKTYHISKAVTVGSMMGQTMEITRTFSDYRKVDCGVFFPYNTEISYGGQFNLTSVVTKVVCNPTVDLKIFDQPKK